MRDFTTDLSDGLRLIKLCEVLSGMKFPRSYAKKPVGAFQKMANITEALDFMVSHFHVTFVGLNAQGMLQLKLRRRDLVFFQPGAVVGHSL